MLDPYWAIKDYSEQYVQYILLIFQKGRFGLHYMESFEKIMGFVLHMENTIPFR